jgi:hypothetical protein
VTQKNNWRQQIGLRLLLAAVLDPKPKSPRKEK